MTTEDKKLLRLLKKDPNEGMKTVIGLYTGIVTAAVKGRLTGFPHGSADVEDCVAETFVRFYSALDAFDPKLSSIRTYLCVIARNTAANLTRSLHPAVPIDDGENPIEIPDDSFSARIEEKETLDAVLGEIRKLGKPDSEILTRKYYLGQTSKEIAEALGLTAANVDTRAHRAIEKLKTIFRGESDE